MSRRGFRPALSQRRRGLRRGCLAAKGALGGSGTGGGSLLGACRPGSCCCYSGAPILFPYRLFSTLRGCRKIAHGHLDEQPAAVELHDDVVPAPPSSGAVLTPEGRRILMAIDELPED